MRLEPALEAWARWCHLGISVHQSSPLGVLIDCKGVLTRSKGGSKPLYHACIEADIEAALLALVAQSGDSRAADALRFSYGVNRLPGIGRDSRQVTIAHAMGVSLPTFRRLLRRAKTHLTTQLGLIED